VCCSPTTRKLKAEAAAAEERANAERLLLQQLQKTLEDERASAEKRAKEQEEKIAAKIAEGN
jgi:hypothetical protein